jgi:hypothetical protein
VKGRTHHLLHHVESGQGCRVHHEEPVSLRKESYFSFFWRSFTGHSFAGKGITEDQGCVVLVDFVLFEIEDIEMIFSQTLEMTDVPVANGVIFSEGRAFEFAWAYFRDIVGELRPHSVLHFDFLDQQGSPFLQKKSESEGPDLREGSH